MEIISSFCINDQIIEISFDPSETRLIQEVVYDAESNKIVLNVNRKPLFDLKDPSVNLVDNVVFVNKPNIDTVVAYKINENNTISRISHLHIRQNNGKSIFLYEKSLESYRNILVNIKKEFIKGVFVNYSGTFMYLEYINWSDEFEKLHRL